MAIMPLGLSGKVGAGPGHPRAVVGLFTESLSPPGTSELSSVLKSSLAAPSAFNSEDGFRYTADGTPACVHPHKVGLDPDRIAPPPKPVAVEARRRRGAGYAATVERTAAFLRRSVGRR
ncbi:hypothetical protein GCM10010345_82020 [Streptomyces canarius]|uniref:Uncharacterized protein n=1 Tax=Streptomyces canarius TaxID=285453 RepID=A0ABQ3DBG8_9ACTN|nr:hypothetical protein GCM10010345_82020 [Streptomyces canarius]